MVQIPTISKAPLNAQNLASINSGQSLPVLSAGTVTTLNGWKKQPTSANPAVTVTSAPQSTNTQQATQTSPQVAAATNRAKPAFTNPVKKGQKTTLAAPTSILDIRLGLNTKNPECDVDVSAFLVGKDGKVLDDSWFVFYGQPSSPDGSTTFTVLSNETDRQKIVIDTAKLSSEIDKLIFVLSINEAAQKGLNFSMVCDAYLRILDANGNEICSYEMEDYYDNVVSMVIGEIYRHNADLKFNPVGNGMSKDLGGLCELYGVSVE